MVFKLFTRRTLLPLLVGVVLVPSMLNASGGAAVHQHGVSEERTALAHLLLQHDGVRLLDFHVSGVRDEATAKKNLNQAAEGRPAKRSYYGNAPGGITQLDLRMLRALVILAYEGYEFRITELAGGSHSCNSRHYAGVSFDVDYLDGVKIRRGHPSYRRFLNRCRDLGATEVFGPGDRGHATHLHVAWPRQ